jgi:hypothetical protein
MHHHDASHMTVNVYGDPLLLGNLGCILMIPFCISNLSRILNPCRIVPHVFVQNVSDNHMAIPGHRDHPTQGPNDPLCMVAFGYDRDWPDRTGHESYVHRPAQWIGNAP